MNDRSIQLGYYSGALFVGGLVVWLTSTFVNTSLDSDDLAVGFDLLLAQITPWLFGLAILASMLSIMAKD